MNIPSGVTSLTSTFEGCTSIGSVTITDSIIRMDRTFKGCTSLHNLWIRHVENGGTEPLVVSDGSFNRCPEDLDVKALTGNLSFVDNNGKPQSSIRDRGVYYYSWDLEHADMFEVRFMTGGGTSVDTLYVEGGTISEPVTSREGYEFTGWYVDSDCTTPFDFSKPISSNTVLYAGWERIVVKYTVTYMFEGQVVGEVEEHEVGEIVRLREQYDPGDGYGASPWRSLILVIHDDGAFMMPDNDITFYSTSLIPKCTVLFQKSMGSFTGVTVIKGEPVSPHRRTRQRWLDLHMMVRRHVLYDPVRLLAAYPRGYHGLRRMVLRRCIDGEWVLWWYPDVFVDVSCRNRYSRCCCDHSQTPVIRRQVMGLPPSTITHTTQTR